MKGCKVYAIRDVLGYYYGGTSGYIDDWSLLGIEAKLYKSKTAATKDARGMARKEVLDKGWQVVEAQLTLPDSPRHSM